MARIRMCDQLVDADGNGTDGYYQVDIVLTSDTSNQGYCTIPGMGRVLVYRKMPRHSFEVPSFAWYIKEISQASER